MAHAATASGIAAHITVTNGEPTTTTQDIAEVYGKDHANVLKVVRKRMAEAGDWGVVNFNETPYTNPQNGQTYTVIRMTEKGFHFVVGKFTGAKAVRHQIAYADEFQRMKAALTQPVDARLRGHDVHHPATSRAYLMVVAPGAAPVAYPASDIGRLIYSAQSPFSAEDAAQIARMSTLRMRAEAKELKDASGFAEVQNQVKALSLFQLGTLAEFAYGHLYERMAQQPIVKGQKA